MTTNSPLVKLKEEGDEQDYIYNISKLTYGDKILFEINKPFFFHDEPYIPSKITPNIGVDGAYNVFIDEINQTAMFLLPALGETLDYYEFDKFLINAYIGYSEDIDEGLHIYLVYRFSTSNKFSDLDTRLSTHNLYIDQFHPDEYHIVYKFGFPDNLEEDYLNVIDSKYSKISDWLKRRILLFFNFSPNAKTSLLYGILHKTSNRRRDLEKQIGIELPKDAELYQAFDFEKNVYTPNEFYKSRTPKGTGELD